MIATAFVLAFCPSLFNILKLDLGVMVVVVVVVSKAKQSKARKALYSVAAAAAATEKKMPLGRREAIAHPVKLLRPNSVCSGNASFVFLLVCSKTKLSLSLKSH